MMAYLLDVNVLIALAWPWHEAHARTRSWFADHAAKGWATCPMTEAGFVRIVSNPSFSLQAVTPKEALRGLEISLLDPAHRFWPDDIPLATALAESGSRLAGHQQITDAYLLALAMHHKGKLATLDRQLARSLPESGRERGYLEIV